MNSINYSNARHSFLCSRIKLLGELRHVCFQRIWIIECQEITDKTSMQKYAPAWTEIANEFNAQVIDGTKYFNFV